MLQISPQKPWKDDPVAWEKFYDDQNVVSLACLGFPSFEKTRIIPEEKPEVFYSLESRIEEKWKAFQAENPKSFNAPKNGVRGREALDVDGKTLVIRAYETDFASLIYNLNRDDGENSTLDSEQRHFLDNNLHFLGVSGYMGLTLGAIRHGRIQHDPQKRVYLCGKADGLKIKKGMWELLPSGFVDPGYNCKEALDQELEQETGLCFTDDILSSKPTHMNFSPKYGNCSLVYDLFLDPISGGNGMIKCSPEHELLGWLTPQFMMDRENRYVMNPVLLKIIENLHPELKQ